MYVTVSACVVEGVFYKGCNPLPLLLLNVFAVFSWVFFFLFISFFFLNSC